MHGVLPPSVLTRSPRGSYYHCPHLQMKCAKSPHLSTVVENMYLAEFGLHPTLGRVQFMPMAVTWSNIVSLKWEKRKEGISTLSTMYATNRQLGTRPGRPENSQSKSKKLMVRREGYLTKSPHTALHSGAGSGVCLAVKWILGQTPRGYLLVCKWQSSMWSGKFLSLSKP
jgi:hypothetical protein